MDSSALLKALTSKSGKERHQLYEEGTYFMGGILGGMFFNDVWRLLHLPSIEQLLPDNPLVKEKGSEIVQTAISGGITVLGIFANVKGATSAGAGMLLGQQWAKSSAEGKYIGAT